MYREQQNQSLLGTWQHIQELQHESHSKVHYTSSKQEALRGEHLTSTPPPPLQILSGFRKQTTDNKFFKNCISIYIQQQRKTAHSLGFRGTRQSRALRLSATTVPKLTVTRLTFCEKSGLQSSFIHR